MTLPRSPADTAHDAVERAELDRQLRDCGGCCAKTARRLGWSRQTLYRRLAAYGLDPGSYREPPGAEAKVTSPPESSEGDPDPPGQSPAGDSANKAQADRANRPGQIDRSGL